MYQRQTSSALRINRLSLPKYPTLAFRAPREGILRTFSTTAGMNIRTTEMTEEQLAGVKIDRSRLWEELHYTCQWGPGERWGV